MPQFSKETPEQKTLADLNYPFPNDVYPVGRLDKDSEGLMILTNDRQLSDKLLNPQHGHARTYMVQVEGDITPQAVIALQKGIVVNIRGKKYNTAKAVCEKLSGDPGFPERLPRIRFRQSIPVSWIRLTLTEGKNRQVRKMTAAAGFPTLRLIRTKIEKLSLRDMRQGEVRTINKSRIYGLLGLS